MILVAAREIPRRFFARPTQQAKLVGLDNSTTMLAKARNDLPQVQFIEGDIAAWPGDPNADLLYANASFQWVPDHVSVLLRLLKGLKAGGVLALQMPDNLAEPSHRLMHETAETGPWAEPLTERGRGPRSYPDAKRILHPAEAPLPKPRYMAYGLLPCPRWRAGHC